MKRDEDEIVEATILEDEQQTADRDGQGGALVRGRIPGLSADRRSVSRSDIYFNPRVHQPSPNLLVIDAMQDDSRVKPWGFWAAVLLGAITVLYLATGDGFHQVWDLLWTTLILGAGVLLARFGRRHLSSLRRRRVATIDLRSGQLLLEQSGEDDEDGSSSLQAKRAISLEGVSEVVFGMIYYPVSHNRSDARVRAYTLMVRDEEGQLFSILEVCADKEETYALANLLARLSQAPLSQVGAGVDYGSRR